MSSLAEILGLGTTTNQSSRASLSVANSVLQAASSECSISCNQDQSGNVIIITNSDVGDITFSQTCSIVGSQCLIKTYLDTNLTNILETMQEQDAVTVSGFADILSGFRETNQTIDVNQHVVNSISQLISNNCRIDTAQAQNNNYVYIGDSTTGNLSFVQSSDITNTDCIMDTIAKAVAVTEESAKTGQKSTTTNMFAIIGLIIACIIIIIIFVVIMMVAKPVVGVGSALSKSLNSG